MIDLMQGDCLERMKEIPDASVDMVLCDLPYGTTQCAWDTVIPFDALWEQYDRIVKNNAAICLFGSEPFSSQLRISKIKWYRYDWIWEKEQGVNFMLCKQQPLKVHENISVFSKLRAAYYPQMGLGKPYSHYGKGDSGEITGRVKKTAAQNTGTRYPRSVQRFDTVKHTLHLHPTQKPVALLEYLIRTYTLPGGVVLDNCMGSGSTGVACVNTGRDFIGIELDERYFEIAKQRIEEANAQVRLTL